MIIGPTSFERAQLDGERERRASPPATIWAPITSPGVRSIKSRGPDRRADRNSRPPVRLGTVCVRATPIRARVMVSRRSFKPTICRSTATTPSQSVGTADRRLFQPEGPSLVALGWEGYSLGFTDFAVQPVIGTYHLYAAVPPAYDTPQNPTPSPGSRRHAHAAAGNSRGRCTAHESVGRCRVCDARRLNPTAKAAERIERYGSRRRNRGAGGRRSRGHERQRPLRQSHIERLAFTRRYA